MKKIFSLLNSDGFTLTEILISVGLLGVVSIGTMKIMDNSNKASKNIEIRDQIGQVQRVLNDILANPNNCEASLGGKTINDQIPTIFQVINSAPVSKYTVGSNPMSDVEIVSMKIKSIDNNGTDGSHALAVLEVGLKKDSALAVGGSVINKEIRINANLCKKDLIDDATLDGVIQKCKGSGKKLLEGPHQWNSVYWAVCQDCSTAGTNSIRSCQSSGGGGIDIGNMSKMQCQNLGGVFDESSLSCNLDSVSAESACTSLGGVFQAGAHACTFSGTTLANFIGLKMDALMPSCIISPSACSGLHGTKMGEYIVKEDTNQNYTWYTVTCKAHFRRVTSPWTKKQWCAVNYNEYAHCGPNGPRVHPHEVCTAQGRTNTVRCSNNYGQRHHDSCFQFDYDACTVTNTETRSETIKQDVVLNKCCK